MWREPVVTVEPEAPALSTADAKEHLRVDHSGEDDLIAAYCAAAQAHVEAMTGLRLSAQTVTIRTYEWADLAHLPIAPVSDVTSVAYVDSAGTPATVDDATYELRLEGLEPGIALLHGEAWPSSRPGSLVTVTCEVGYADVPPPISAALRLIVGDLYANRETTGADGARVEMTPTVEALLSNYRIHLI